MRALPRIPDHGSIARVPNFVPILPPDRSVPAGYVPQSARPGESWFNPDPPGRAGSLRDDPRQLGGEHSVELAGLGSLQESVELGTLVHERGPGGMPGVADRDLAVRQPGQLDTVAAGVAEGGLLPDCALQRCCFDAVVCESHVTSLSPAPG